MFYNWITWKGFSFSLGIIFCEKCVFLIGQNFHWCLTPFLSIRFLYHHYRRKKISKIPEHTKRKIERNQRRSLQALWTFPQILSLCLSFPVCVHASVCAHSPYAFANMRTVYCFLADTSQQSHLLPFFVLENNLEEVIFKLHVLWIRQGQISKDSGIFYFKHEVSNRVGNLSKNGNGKDPNSQQIDLLLSFFWARTQRSPAECRVQVLIPCSQVPREGLPHWACCSQSGRREPSWIIWLLHVPHRLL